MRRRLDGSLVFLAVCTLICSLVAPAWATESDAKEARADEAGKKKTEQAGDVRQDTRQSDPDTGTTLVNTMEDVFGASRHALAARERALRAPSGEGAVDWKPVERDEDGAGDKARSRDDGAKDGDEPKDSD